LLGLSADEYQRKSGKPPISLEAFREARRQRAAATGVVPAPPTPPPPKDPVAVALLTRCMTGTEATHLAPVLVNAIGNGADIERLCTLARDGEREKLNDELHELGFSTIGDRALLSRYLKALA